MQGVSKTKFIKGTDIPKRSGNFSYTTVHHDSLQSKDYRVRLVNNELIVGESTPLSYLFPFPVVELALKDAHFDSYVQRGEKTVNGKKYEARKHLNRFWGYGHHMYNNFLFTYREEIYTDGDFDYNFPNY